MKLAESTKLHRKSEIWGSLWSVAPGESKKSQALKIRGSRRWISPQTLEPVSDDHDRAETILWF